MKYMYFIFLFFLPFSLKAGASAEERKQSADQLLLAFQMQCNARSNLDSYNACVVFNCAKAQLESMGESQHKIDAIQSLWTWYRTYGYNCGLALEPVKCPGEYISDKKYIPKKTYGNNLDPKQQQVMRDFLFGVGEVISGVFCLVVNPPVSGRFGITLIATGIKYLWDSVNDMMVDFREKNARFAELEHIQKLAEMAIK